MRPRAADPAAPRHSAGAGREDRLTRSIIALPGVLQRRLERSLAAQLAGPPGMRIDFSRPLHEEALVGPDSVSWRIFKNPVALFVGGVAAVVLELAEPSVRAGVWEHSAFRTDPVGRLRRTALAAMVTVYGARSVALPLIAGVVRKHASVDGRTADGVSYSARDPRLLGWVHATAVFGFAQAYRRYVHPLTPCDVDALYREGTPAARLYGASDSPQSAAEMQALFESMRGTLLPSPVVFEFLRIVSAAPALPRPFRWLQPMLVRAAVDLTPAWIRERLGLAGHGLRAGESWIVEMAGNLADRVVPSAGPAAQSCLRLGLPVTHLYR